jgi:hypothetical protein
MQRSLIFLSLALIYIALNVNGFAFSRLQFLSDDDLLREVIVDTIGRDQHFQRSELQYSSVEDFFEQNPHCCSVQGDIITSPELANEGDWLNWLWHRRAVTVCYRRRHTGDAQYYELVTFRDNVGTDLDTYGMEATGC